jgi:hypothetical protein
VASQQRFASPGGATSFRSYSAFGFNSIRHYALQWRYCPIHARQPGASGLSPHFHSVLVLQAFFCAQPIAVCCGLAAFWRQYWLALHSG